MTRTRLAHGGAPDEGAPEGTRLLPLDVARTRIVQGAGLAGEEGLALDNAVGRVLAQPVIARRDQPPFATSAMDGWAVRRVDGVGPRRIVGESAAGRAFGTVLGEGQAVRIFTGAPLPAGADQIIIQEAARREGETLFFEALGDDYVRPKGLDFRAGAPLVAAGRILTPGRIALAAAAGQAQLAVRVKPRIALLANGDELVPPGKAPGADQIFESVTYGLAALIGAWGGVAHRLSPGRDDPVGLADAAHKAQSEADLVVLIGGASVGDHDFARQAADHGRMRVESVALRPGKPTWFAQTPAGPILGLPGNPASALVAARLFLRPWIEAALGVLPQDRASGFVARLGHGLGANGARAHVRRAIIRGDAEGRLVAHSDFSADSSMLTPFGAANALIVQPPHAPESAAGALTEAHWLCGSGAADGIGHDRGGEV